MAKKRFLETGRITNAHGVRGEVKIQPWSDTPEFLLGIKSFYIDGREYRSELARIHKNTVIVRFEGVRDVNAAMALKNKVVFIDRDEVSLEEGSYFIQDALGLPVFDVSGDEIGTLADVLKLPGGDVFVVRGKGERLIPSNGSFIKEVDIDGGRIVVDLIEGM